MVDGGWCGKGDLERAAVKLRPVNQRRSWRRVSGFPATPLSNGGSGCCRWS